MKRILPLAFLSVLPMHAQLSIATTSLPDGLLGSTYGTFVDSGGLRVPATLPRLQATGASGSVSFTLNGGTLPPGLSLETNGAIRGIPSGTGAYSFNVRVADTSGSAASSVLRIAVLPRDFSPARRSRVGVPYVNYNFPCTSSSGATFTYTILSGSLPPGITLDQVTGFLAGTPTREGSYTYVWQCASSSFTVSRNQVFTIEPYQRISLTATVGQPYDRVFTGFDSNVGRPIQSQLFSGALPPGITLADPNTPRLTGVPTQTGTFQFVVRWTDSAGHIYEASYTMVIEPQGSFQLSANTLELAGVQNGADASRIVSVSANRLGLSFSAAASTQSGGPWLRVTPSTAAIPGAFEVIASPTGLAEGTYLGVVKVAAPGSSPEERTLQIVYSVGAALAPRLEPEQPRLSFFSSAGSSVSARALRIFNRGSGVIPFTASTRPLAAWLTVTPAEAAASAVAPAILLAGIDPSGLEPGTYSGAIVISAADQPALEIPVTLAINSASRSIEISQTGLRFSTPPRQISAPQTLFVTGSGTEAVSWTAAASTVLPGSWLKIDRVTGESTPGAAGTGLAVSVDAAGLEPGDYYGSVVVESPNASGSPQTAVVALRVTGPEDSVTPAFSPASLVFLRAESQRVVLTNASETTARYRAAIGPAGSEDWLTLDAQSGTIAPGASAELVAQADPAGLPPGVYSASISVQFDSAAPRQIPVLLIVPPAASQSAKSGPRLAEGCAPAALYPVITSVSSGFASVAGWPTPVEVIVADDCAQVMTQGTVIASFSNGDPPLSLRARADGRWSATWSVRQVAAEMEITVRAISPDRKLEGVTKLAGGASLRSAIPHIDPDGVTSSVSLSAGAALAPGDMVAIRGAALAEGEATADSLPLPVELGKSSVFIGGRRAPMRKTAEGRLEAILPASLTPNAAHQLIVQRGAALAIPETVTIAAAQPAVFTTDGSGKGQGLIYWVKEDGAQAPANVDSPARRGAVLVVYCAGLGAVDPPVEDGAAPPADPLSKVTQRVTVKVGEVATDADSAYLLPGFPGVYAAVVTLPAEAPAGPEVPLTVIVGGQASRPVTLAIAE